MEMKQPAELAWSPTRRQFIAATGAVGAGAVAAPLINWNSVVGAAPYTGSTVVVIFLRGGCDGLSLLPPINEAAYFDARPTIAVPQAAALPLAGVAAHPDFGWHPGAGSLSDLYDSGRVAVVPAAGSPDHSRSHFDCEDGIESGRPEDRYSVVGGWLGRYLTGSANGDHPLRAFTAGSGLPPSMHGYPGISARSLDQLGLIEWGPRPEFATQAITAGYSSAAAGDELSGWAQTSIAALDEVAQLTAGETSPPESWPDGWLADRMFTIARLVESGLPTEVATVDLGGWDHHDEVGSAVDPSGRTHSLIATLDAALGAFFARLDQNGVGHRVTVVTMTEFGRRTEENDSGGVDHGYGGPMIVAGAGVNPGVQGAWPTLDPAALNDGDLDVAVDQRSVLSELLVSRLGAGNLGNVFPGFDTSSSNWVGVCA